MNPFSRLGPGLTLGPALILLLCHCDRSEKEPSESTGRAPRPPARAIAPAPLEQAQNALSSATGETACFQAAALLAESGGAQAVPILIEAATTRSDKAEIGAILDSFKHFTDPEALRALAEQSLRGKSRAVFQAAIDALRERGDERTVDQIVNLLYERPAPADRMHKARLMLQNLENPSTGRALARLVATAEEPGVVDAAAIALGKQGTDTARHAIEAALNERSDLTPALRMSLQRSLDVARQHEPATPTE